MDAHLDKAVGRSYAIAEVVGTGEMSIQRGRVELGQDIHFINTTIDAIAHWHIDKPVCPTYRYLSHKENNMT